MPQLGPNFQILNTQPQAPQMKMYSTPGQSDDGIGGILGSLGKIGSALQGVFGSNPVSTTNAAVTNTLQNIPQTQVANTVLPQSVQPPPSLPQGLPPSITQNSLGNMAQNVMNSPLSRMSPQQATQANVLGQQMGAVKPTQGQPDTLHQTMSAIAGVETGGAKNPYVEISKPARNGTVSVGKYQISESNIPSWTREATGKAYTKDQFLADPQLQEKTASFQMNKLMQQGHSPNDVASIWFTGKPLNKVSPTVKDTYGTTNEMYQNKFNSYYNKPTTLKTQAVGSQQISSAVQASQSGNPYNVASQYLGDGVKQHAEVLTNFFQKSGMGNVNPATTPWCAAFANSVLKSSGYSGTGSLTAKSFLNYGAPTNTPQKGDIAVFNDLTSRNDPAHGHVGFVDSIVTKNGQQYVRTLGGNEDGAVSIKDYPMSKIAGFRQPPTAKELQVKSQQPSDTALNDSGTLPPGFSPLPIKNSQGIPYKQPSVLGQL